MSVDPSIAAASDSARQRTEGVNTDSARPSSEGHVTIVDTDEQHAMTVLLGSILDSFEKLEIVVYLHGRAIERCDTRSIGRHLQLDPEVVVKTLADLVEANILCAPRGDDTGWWFDPDGPWTTTIDVLVELYTEDRNGLMRLIRRIALQQLEPDVRLRIFASMRRPRGLLLPN